jgi:predicted Zn-dependent peptidase
VRAFALGCLLAAAGGMAQAQAQEAGSADKRATAFTLSNGLRFVVLERHTSPLISFHTYVNAGSVNDPAGQTGLARLLERMAAKGSESIGSRNWPDERKALEAQDEAYERMEAERGKGPLMNQGEFETLRTHWRVAVDAALRLAQPGEYLKILQESEATAIKSNASWNSLEFSYTLPSNRLELWYAMESQRLMHPVLRDFFKERDALLEERRPAITPSTSDLQARVLDTFLSTAFTAHPYRNPTNGWPSDAAELSRSEARVFLEKYFVPGNIVIGMAGDVNPEEAKRLAEKYFGAMPARPMPPVLHTVEPPQQGPRTSVLEMMGQTFAAIGYKRPSYFDKDDAVLDVIQDLLTLGNSGLLYRGLVQERRLAIGVRAGSTFPDGRYPSVFLFVLVPAPGHTVEENQKALDEVLYGLKTQKVGEEALNRAKSHIRSISYHRLESNAGMAEMLALYMMAFGDWKPLFSLIEDVGKVTEDDVMRVAQKYFVAAGRSTVYTTIPGLPQTARSGEGQ